jgi:hypothetical protein
MGRADYNEAINKTEDEQMLLSGVGGRYGETFSLLSVSGVAASEIRTFRMHQRLKWILDSNVLLNRTLTIRATR